MKLQEIEDAYNHFKICPNCNSRHGFWLGLRFNHACVQCKGCGAKFELFEFYATGEKGEVSAHKLKLFWR